jgi:hypothetical protein
MERLLFAILERYINVIDISHIPIRVKVTQIMLNDIIREIVGDIEFNLPIYRYVTRNGLHVLFKADDTIKEGEFKLEYANKF